MMKKITGYASMLVLTLFAFAQTVFAAGPIDYQLGFQPAASPVKEEIDGFHNMLLYITFAIAIFVLVLLLIIIFRFNEKSNPKPAKFTHNTLLEMVWTIIPVLIVAVIAIKSTQVLFYMNKIEDTEMTIKAIGYQWYWGYEYPDHGGIAFNAYMIKDEEINEAAGQKRLLSTDNPVVLPVDTNIEILVTAADVIHSFAMPSFGLKTDAIPGRLNSTWVRINEPGTYYGQCSELCGKDHAYMPIEVVAVTKDEFEDWTKAAAEEFASYHDFKAARDRMALITE